MTAPDLPAFLLARLAEDEAVARAIGNEEPLAWSAVRADSLVIDAENPKRWIARAEDRGHGDDLAAHIARHDPARVLADVESKRRVVEDYLDAQHTIGGLEEEGDYEAALGHVDEARVLLAVLHRLAQPYASHESFDPSWRL